MTPTLIWSIVSFVLGTVFGVFLAILSHILSNRRARRTEYNELADAVFIAVDRTVDPYDGHQFRLPSGNIKLLRRRMSGLQKRRFDQAISAYEAAAQQTTTDDHGHVHFNNPTAVNTALKAIANELRRQ